ncbi:MAG TPA: hypothetical protein VFW11_05240, partial [Cyclobacteriaceae bacterium]|nr:hypothetical protein [Cyclobacteriaceae bacterium]
LISWVVVNCGVLFEHRSWVRWAEWIRIFVYPLLLAAVVYYLRLSISLYILAFIYFALSAGWFYVIQRNDPKLQVA